MTTSPMPRNRVFGPGVFALLGVTILVFLTSLPNAFVYDDFDYVVNNPLMQQKAVTLGDVAGAAYPPNHPELHLYRPLVGLSFLLDRAAWGMAFDPGWRPTRFHVTNLLWHLGVVALLCLLIARVREANGRSEIAWPALIAAALFAWHPLVTESVAWVVGRAEVMAAFFSLAALHAWLGARRSDRAPRRWFVAAWAAYGLAILCKESAIMLPALVVLVEWLLLPKPEQGGRTRRAGLAGFAAVAVVYALWRWHLFAGIPMEHRAYEGVTDSWTRMLVAGKVMARSALMVLVPYRQSVFHEVQVERLWSALADAGLVVALAWAAARRGRQPAWLAGGLWFLVALLPVSNLLWPIGERMAERFLYWPLAGCALALGLGLGDRLRARPWLLAAAAAILLHHGVKTAVRAADWHNARTLWQSAADVYPGAFIVHAQLGFALLDGGDPASARPEFARSLQLLAGQPSEYQRTFKARIGKAIERCDAEASGAAEPAELERIHAVARQGRFADAVPGYTDYLGRHPGSASARRALADCLFAAGRFAEASAQWQALLQGAPKDARLHAKLALTLVQMGRDAEARTQYRSALDLDPGDAWTWFNLGVLDARSRDFAAAASSFERAVKIDPARPAFRYNLAVSYTETGRKDEAAEQLKDILKSNPADAAARELLDRIRKP